MAIILPPVPPGQDVSSFAWKDWFTKIQAIFNGIADGVFPWTSIDFTGSTITDILSRSINDTTGTLIVSRGGTSLNTLTTNALYVGNGTSAPVALSLGRDGELLQGVSGSAPAWNAPVSPVGNDLYLFYNSGGF
tara:strand:- start:944 stop:1345 length:402 start_codon:yes stop_codon:yes gene_type:complete